MTTLETLNLPAESNEAAEKISVVALHFMRHGEKESDKTKSDYQIALTEKGRDQAMDKSDLESEMGQSVAYGSPRERTQQTAALAMAGGQDAITGDESLAELKEKLNAELAVGSKIGSDERLNFNDNFSTPYGQEAIAAFKRGEFLKFLVEKSDSLAAELHDLDGSTYSRMAKGVAEIILKYVTVSSRWHELVNDPEKDYSANLNRFFGSHQGLLESFLAKAIEKTKGPAERDRFVSLLQNKGFDYTEGYDVEIRDSGNPEDLKIHVTYKKEVPEGEPFIFDEDINVGLLKEIAG